MCVSWFFSPKGLGLREQGELVQASCFFFFVVVSAFALLHKRILESIMMEKPAAYTYMKYLHYMLMFTVYVNCKPGSEGDVYIMTTIVTGNY